MTHNLSAGEGTWVIFQGKEISRTNYINIRRYRYLYPTEYGFRIIRFLQLYFCLISKLSSSLLWSSHGKHSGLLSKLQMRYLNPGGKVLLSADALNTTCQVCLSRGWSSYLHTDAPTDWLSPFTVNSFSFPLFLAALLYFNKVIWANQWWTHFKHEEILDPREFMNTTLSLIICDSVFSDFSSTHTDYSNILKSFTMSDTFLKSFCIVLIIFSEKE